MIKLKYLEVHQPLFLSGKNFGTKLNTEQLSGLELDFHPDKSMVTVKYNGQVSFFNWVNAANMIPKNASDIGFNLEAVRKVETHVSHPMTNGISSAQVETPASHVFKGKGQGKVKDIQ